MKGLYSMKQNKTKQPKIFCVDATVSSKGNIKTTCEYSLQNNEAL